MGTIHKSSLISRSSIELTGSFAIHGLNEGTGAQMVKMSLLRSGDLNHDTQIPRHPFTLPLA